MLYDNLDVNAVGHLTIAGIDAIELAAEYGTPLYVLDEDRLRARAHTYVSAMRKHFGDDAQPLFASKALCFKGIYPVIEAEGMAADVVSAGEVATALAAGFPAANLYFHGTNKPDADIRYGVEHGVGTFVVDNTNELEALGRIACELGRTQNVLLRLTVGIDPHTFAAVKTGKIDSQFGLPIETGQAMAFLREALATEGVNVIGFHSHIGSQIFEAEPFCDQVDRLMAFATDARDELGYVAGTFNLGGGFAVPYTDADPAINYETNIATVAAHLKAGCEASGYPYPRILMEPGRSTVADSGVTLYTTGGTKIIEGYRAYVSIDGGMTDNPRFALYKSLYTVLNASRANAPANFTCTIAGRCCESGDRIAEDVRLARPERGDIIAVLTTGAYNFSMANNYNRVPRPALVMVSGGSARLAVRRQTIEDMLALEL